MNPSVVQGRTESTSDHQAKAITARNCKFDPDLWKFILHGFHCTKVYIFQSEIYIFVQWNPCEMIVSTLEITLIEDDIPIASFYFNISFVI